MPIVFGKAPGKIILFGEHAVVYGQPAIAIPVHRVSATARIIPNIEGQPGQVHIQAPDIDLNALMAKLDNQHPIAAAVRLVAEKRAHRSLPAFTLQVTSTIPIASGMGSGAAVSVAIIRALSSFLGMRQSNESISQLAFEIEKIHHGTPSGIDNTVVTFGQPVYFEKGKTNETFQINHPFSWVIGNTGLQTPTKETVGDVRQAWKKDPETMENIFIKIGRIVRQARRSLLSGDQKTLGRLMNENQTLLKEINVSCKALEDLIHAARQAGAYGAKLSGGGRGGNIIALCPPEKAADVMQALKNAGATHVIQTQLGKARPS